LKPYLSNSLDNKATKENIIQKAIELNGKGYEGTKVITELLSVIKPKTKRNKPKVQHTSKNGLVNIQIQKRKDNKIELLIDKKDKGSKEDVTELLSSVLDDYY